MARGFIDKISLGTVPDTFSGSIVDGDGDLLTNFTDVAIIDGLGGGLKDPAECGSASFVQFTTVGKVDGAPVEKMTRLVSVKASKSIPDNDVATALRRAARQIGTDATGTISSATIVKG